MRGTDCKFLDHGTTGRLTFPLLTILLHQYDLEIILASLVLGPKLPDAIGTSSQNLKHSLSGNTASLPLTNLSLLIYPVLAFPSQPWAVPGPSSPLGPGFRRGSGYN